MCANIFIFFASIMFPVVNASIEFSDCNKWKTNKTTLYGFIYLFDCFRNNRTVERKTSLKCRYLIVFGKGPNTIRWILINSWYFKNFKIEKRTPSDGNMRRDIWCVMSHVPNRFNAHHSWKTVSFRHFFGLICFIFILMTPNFINSIFCNL